jgi:uncharacterized delta-60 repeat protein
MKNLIFLCVILVPVILSAQTQRWVYQYNGPGNSYDAADHILYGPDGNLYTAGYAYNTSTYYDILILSLTSIGSQRWLYRYDRNQGHDQLHALVLGGDGNLYAAGFTSYTLGDLAIIKLTSSGTQRWIYNYDGPAYDGDEALDIVYGGDGKIYACGRSVGIGTNDDFTVISVDTAGTFRWVYRFNGNANSYDEARSIIYGSDGNIYAAGFTSDSANSRDLTVISLDTSGVLRWIYTYDGLANNFGEANSIIWGNDENLYVAGISRDTITTIFGDFTILSITPAGNERWVYNTYGTGMMMTNEAFELVYGADGNIYAVGNLTFATTYNDIAVVSLTSNGSERWRYWRANNGMDLSTDICYGSDGNIYVTGRIVNPSPTNEDFLILSLFPSGNFRWMYNYNGTANYGDAATSITYASDGNIYASGSSYNTTTLTDYTIISLNPAYGILEKNPVLITDRLSLKVFPNPAKTYFTICLPQSADRLEIKIFDITGKEVKRVWGLGVGDWRISLDGIKNGIYFVKINDAILKDKLVVTK